MQLSLINPVDEMGAEQSDAPWPIIIRKGECIGMKEAEDLSGASGKSIARYCKAFGIGAHAHGGGPWRISAPALVMVIHGDIQALELLRSGKREHPRVTRYFNELGIPV